MNYPHELARRFQLMLDRRHAGSLDAFFASLPPLVCEEIEPPASATKPAKRTKAKANATQSLSLFGSPTNDQ